jgi:hypothetical protein
MIVLAANYDFAGFNVNVNIGSGSFQGFGARATVGGGFLKFLGNGTANTKITAGPNDGVYNFGESFGIAVPVGPTFYSLDLLTVQVPPNNFGIVCYQPIAQLGLGDQSAFTTTFAFDLSIANASSTAIIGVEAQSVFIVPSGPISINGGTVQDGFQIHAQGFFFDFGTWTITGAPTWSNCFLELNNGFYSMDAASYSGAATGKRYQFVSGSVGGALAAGQLGPTFFPGNAAGTSDPSSYYDGFPGPFPGINTQTGASYTLVIGDAYYIVEMNNAGANTLTVPLNATVAFEIGTKIWITQTGAGATSIAGAGGVTVDGAGAIGGQWKTSKLYKRGTDEWVQTNA